MFQQSHPKIGTAGSKKKKKRQRRNKIKAIHGIAGETSRDSRRERGVERPWFVSVSKAPSLINTPQLMLCLRGTQVLSSLAPSGKVRGFHIVCEGIKNTKGAINLQPNINQLLWARLGAGKDWDWDGGEGLEEEGGMGGGRNGPFLQKTQAVKRGFF